MDYSNFVQIVHFRLHWKLVIICVINVIWCQLLISIFFYRFITCFEIQTEIWFQTCSGSKWYVYLVQQRYSLMSSSIHTDGLTWLKPLKTGLIFGVRRACSFFWSYKIMRNWFNSLNCMMLKFKQLTNWITTHFQTDSILAETRETKVVRYTFLLIIVLKV